MKHFLPPPVTPSGEEPIAAGGWQTFATFDTRKAGRTDSNKTFLPPPMTPLVEEPIGMGGR